MLTNAMTRLCGEIVALRKMRGSMVTELQRDVATLCAHFGSARTAMANRTRNERAAFMNHLRRSVGAQRREFRADLAGARRAWAGKSS